MVAIDNRTGQIKAMVGGWDFDRSKFNRAVQAYPAARIDVQADRLHAAIDRGFTPRRSSSTTPVSYPSGNGQRLQLRRTTITSSKAPITLRRALEESRNIPGDQDDGRARPEERARLRQAVRVRGGLPAVSADRARRRRRDAASK